jgi:hypothetical protein
MANHYVKKTASRESTDISGMRSSRYEKLQVSYGTIEASSYSLLDTLVFDEIPSKEIVSASIVAHTAPPTVLDILPDTDLAAPLVLGGLTSPAKLSYVIRYVRGTGAVGESSAMESLLQVVIGDVSSLNSSQIANLSTKQFAEMSTAQIASITTSQIPSIETRDIAALTPQQVGAMTTSQVVALTTAQIPAIEPLDFAAFNTKQLRAMETRDVAALTAAELSALNTKQLHSFTTAQTAVLSTSQKAMLTSEQLTALQ